MSGRGDEAGESSGSQEPAGAAEPQKRRRGDRGSPRKSQKAEATGVKRPRGRPRKWGIESCTAFFNSRHAAARTPLLL
ncbi:hypothetical protein INR49_000200 [Caranx melampygus]|nr:hypothetical protein INR49_000200 [Caranx melampygus]